MLFTKAFTSLCVVATTSMGVSASPIEKRALTANQMVTNINQLTTLSQQLAPKVSAIQSGNSIIARQFSNPFQPAIDGFQQIIRVATDDISNMDGTQPYGDADAKKVCTAFNNFVITHQELLKIVIGKSGLLEGIFLGPVAAVLRSLENVVDTLAFGVIDSVPVCEAQATKQKSNLDDTLGKAVCAYTPAGSLGLNLFC